MAAGASTLFFTRSRARLQVMAEPRSARFLAGNDTEPQSAADELAQQALAGICTLDPGATLPGFRRGAPFPLLRTNQLDLQRASRRRPGSAALPVGARTPAIGLAILNTR